MGDWVRIDRRYKNPYRLTHHARLMLLKWVGLFLLVVILGTTAKYVGAICLLLYLAYAGYSFRRMRIGPRQTPPPNTDTAGGLAPVAYGYLAPPPLGERNTRTISQDVKIAVSVRDGGRCRQCGSDVELHYDHVIPWSKGGANTVNNIQLLCGPCNRRKGAKDSEPI